MSKDNNAQQVREITEKLEQGIKELFESDRFKEYLTTMSKFYHYSFNNTLLIAMQKPEATYVAGYTSWKRNFQRQVMKGEKGIRILAPAPYKAQVEMEKIDPKTQRPILDSDGKPLKETVEVMRSAFKVVSVFDVSQTEGKELPDIIVDELSGNVVNFTAFFEALKQESPVPIGFENISEGAKGYYHLTERRIAIQEGMSEVQTVKTAIHEIAHAKLHNLDQPEPKPKWKVVMISDGGTEIDRYTGFETEDAAIAAAAKDNWLFVDENQFEWRLDVVEDTSGIENGRKDRHTREVEAEAVAYTVCQRYGIETSDYSFGYIAGWSSGKEIKELKGSLETIRKTAADMIDSIDDKLKVLLKEQTRENDPSSIPEEKRNEEDKFPPIYRNSAEHAQSAGEMELYMNSLQENMDCRDAIENAVSTHFKENHLNPAGAKDVIAQFGAERVQYVLANTVQQKSWDGRISASNKEWAKGIDVFPNNSTQFMVVNAHAGITNLFINQVRDELAAMSHEKEQPRHPEVVAWENDQITSISVKSNPVQSPVIQEAMPPQKHILTKDEKLIREAVMDTLKGQISYSNDGMRSSYRVSEQSHRIMARNGVRIDGDTVTQNGEPIFAIQRRHSARKTQGCYRELVPRLEYIRKDQKQEKPSIRSQLKAPTAAPSEKKTPTKSKNQEMELG